jgi:hypothetical protein
MVPPRLLALLVCTALLSTVALAQFGVPLGHEDANTRPARIRELVSQYCRLDYEGARLNPPEWPKLQPLVAWKSNPDFPIVNVISRFTIDEQPVLEHGKYSINVHYRLLGRFVVNEGFSKDSTRSTEDVSVTVGQVNGDWRITDVEPNYPHPSRAAMLKWLNDNLAKTNDATAKTVYEHAISDLQVPGSTPPPAK